MAGKAGRIVRKIDPSQVDGDQPVAEPEEEVEAVEDVAKLKEDVKAEILKRFQSKLTPDCYYSLRAILDWKEEDIPVPVSHPPAILDRSKPEYKTAHAVYKRIRKVWEEKGTVIFPLRITVSVRNKSLGPGRVKVTPLEARYLQAQLTMQEKNIEELKTGKQGGVFQKTFGPTEDF